MARKKALEDEQAIALSPAEVGSKNLGEVMKEEAAKRSLITKYIGAHMTSGVDFGTIKFGGKESKPSLFKPGSEKFLSLFKLTARFEKDTDTWEMAGSEAGVFAYRCLLYTKSGEVVGEGRGISKLSEKQGWTINNAVKIAEKRAQIDAVLRTGALSDFFTQDLEDMAQQYDKTPIANNAKVVVYTPAHEEGAVIDYSESNESHPWRPSQEEISGQRREISNLLAARGVNVKDGEECKRYVADETQLALVPVNYGAIIKALTSK